MSFSHPLLLLTLLAIPAAVGLWLLAERRRMRYAVRFTNLEVLAGVAGAGRSWRRYAAPLVFLVALAALCVAVARPHVKTLVSNEQATVILVVDESRSMQATDVKPSRLGAAQAAVRAFLDNVPKRVRVALVAFSGEPQVATPPTTDHDLVRQSVDSLGLYSDGRGTAIGDALEAAVELGLQAVGDQKPSGTARTIAVRTSKPPVAILFLSDGAQTRGFLQPLDGAEKAKEAGIPVFTVALGTPNGTLPGFGFGFGPRRVPPDPATLRLIAETTGGEFFAARSADALSSAYEDLGSRLGRVPGKTEVTNRFVAGAAVLLAAAGLLGALWSPRLP